jgi:hypothetical protein
MLETTSSHPEPPNIQSLEVMAPGIESEEVVALLSALDPSICRAASGNNTLKVLSMEASRLPASVEAASQDHHTVIIVLCPGDHQRTSSAMPRQVSGKNISNFSYC